MARVLQAQEIEAGVEEDSGYFYQRLGELRFTPDPSDGSQQGQGQRLAVASRHGVAVFADQKEVYVAKVHDLLTAATKGEEDQELPPANAEEVCACTLPVAAASVALSSDEELLAAWDSKMIYVWSLSMLINKRDTMPLTEWLVPDGTPVKQLAWRPLQAPDAVPEAAVVTMRGKLLRGSLGGRLQALPDVAAGVVSCVAWSADGQLLALASANCITVQHVESGRHFRTEFDSKEAKDADGSVTVDTLAWSGPNSLLVSANLHPNEDLEAEMDIAPLALVRWAAWDVHAGADPEELQLTEFIPPPINPDAAARDSGPYARIALVPAWGAIVVAHSKASDDHIRLFEHVPGGEAKGVDVTEDWSAIRIPTAMDYNDNYVTGLGIDFTSTEVEVMPPDPEASALAPSPVLLVATSDGALRLFTFAHMTKPTEGIVAPARPYSDTLPPMASEEQAEQSEMTQEQTQDTAAAAPLPSDNEEEEEDEEEEEVESVSARQAGETEPAAAAPSSRPVKAQEAKAAATALPLSSDEDDSSSSERGPETSSSSSAPAARAARAALLSNDSDLEDDADSLASQGASFDGGERPSISRLDLAQQSDEDDGAESRAPLGPMTGRKLDFGGEAEAPQKTQQPLAPSIFGQSQATPSLFGAPSAPPSTSAPSTSAVPIASIPNSFSFGSLPAFSSASAGAFGLGKQTATTGAASFETALDGTAIVSAPRAETPSNLGIFGTSTSPFGGTSSSAFGAASGTMPKMQGSQALPPQPPQSAAQKAIAKAREASEAAALSKAEATPFPPPALPSATPQPSLQPAAPERSAFTAPAATASAPRSSQQQRAVIPVRQKPPAPVARLKGESKELAAMEGDFLKTLAESREMEHAFSEAMARSEGDKASGPGTRLGFHSLQERTDALKRSVADILDSLATERRRFGELHNGWREDRARAEALLYFNGKHSERASANGDVDDDDALDPALQDLATSIDTQLQALQKPSCQLNDCLKALEERLSLRQSGAGSAPRASAQQLYNAVNAQTAVASAQLERLEMLWQKLHDMGISGEDDGEEGGSGGPPSFPYISAISASRPSSSAVDSPGDSSRPTWQQVRKSPLGRPKPRRPALLSPLSSLAAPAESPWASTSAGSLRRLLLEKVSIEGGGVRLTRMSGTDFLRPPRANGQDATEWSTPTKDVFTSQQPPAVEPAKPAPLASPFTSSIQPDVGAVTFKAPTLPSFGQSAGLTRAGSSAAVLDRIQPQAAPMHQWNPGHRARQPSISPAGNAAEARGQLARKESTASADSSGSTSNALLRTKHARPSSTPDFAQGPSKGNGRPFQRQASGMGLARAGSAALGPAEPADSSDSAAGSTNRGPTLRSAPPPSMQASIPEDAVPTPSAAKMPPVPTKAALAAAHAHGQAALQKAAPSPAARMPPVPSRAAVAAAQAQGQAALRASGATPVAKTPPVPDRATVAAAQAKGQAALQQSAPAPPAAKVPPVPSKAAVAAAQAQGQAALQKKTAAAAPAAKMPPVPSKAAMAAAHAQAQAALQKPTPAAPSAKTSAATASISSPFAPPSASAAPAASPAQPVFNFAKLTTGDAASPAVSQPVVSTAQPSVAFSFASAMSASMGATGTTTAAGQTTSLFGSMQASSQPAGSSPAASQPLFGSSGVPSPVTSFSQPLASAPAPSISFGAPSAANFGSTAASAAPSSTFGGFGQQAATPSSPLTSTFGSQAPSPSTSAFGTLSFGTAASQPASSPAALTSGFSAFGGLGQPTPASTPAASPFGKGISFGTPVASSAPSPFGSFGQPSSGGAATGFAGFSQSSPAFGQPQSPISSAAPSSGAFSGGFGQSSGFGQAAGGGFGQPSPLGGAFGQLTKPGFGQAAAASPAFGAPAMPGFGAPATPGFGSPAAPSPPFGSATGSNAFGAAAAQGSGFAPFASMAGQPSAFNAAAQAGGGFGAAAQQGGGFGGFGGGSGFGALGGAASSPAAAPGNSDMWQMRK